MKKGLFLTLFLMSIHSISIATPQIAIQTLQQLDWQTISLAQSTQTTLTAQHRQRFTEKFAGIASPVAAYRLPANQGSLHIEIDSLIVNDQVFIPNVMVFDSHFNPATQYPASTFKFQGERGLSDNRFSAELNLTPTPNQDDIYLLIYTTAQDLAQTTTIPHPAKTYAKAMGNQPPAINDLKIKHSLNGKITIKVSNEQTTRFIGLDKLFSSANKNAAILSSVTPTQNPQAINISVDKDTENYFNQAVTKALKAGDINKAMNLVNEAEKLGLTSPRQRFLQGVSTKYPPQ
ncbi:maltose operon protein MalM [Volucribacter amazonae]|uniref:Maltose operon protein MalM n=1 Tax=Volucribacter amazonae TaxID=256731 RepID=A0A9X4PCM2_9PAST|nr:maltose operon protein MalM [Volucribacter amazonae]MDG6894906.1 maltose operon protein MalM [Volucribacter amazonae]